MNSWVAASLVLRNRVRQEGTGTYLARVGILSVLNMLLLAAIFTTASGARLDLDMLAERYVYFLPLLALTASVGSWEVELFAGLGEGYLMRPAWVWPTRLLVSVVECLIPVGALLRARVVTAGGRRGPSRVPSSTWRAVRDAPRSLRDSGQHPTPCPSPGR